MAFITYPLNNIDYTAEDAELFHCTRTSGVWAKNSFPLSVTGADNKVTVGKGIAWINNEEFSGKVAALKSAKVVDLGIVDSVYPRIDVIAIQFNANNNETDIVVKKGTPATNPIQPTIVRTGAVYELYLASIYRPAGVTTITASNITDLRMDKTVCGLMADSVTEIDMSAIEAQVRGLISNLQNEIDKVKDLTGLMFESEWVEDGVIPIIKGGTGANKAAEALSNLGGTSKTLLWTNAKPSSPFVSQTLREDVLGTNFSQYNEIQVEFKITDSSDFYVFGYFVKTNSSHQFAFSKQATDAADTIILDRTVTAYNSTVYFGGGTQKTLIGKTSATNAGVLVPVRIWGIKGVQ